MSFRYWTMMLARWKLYLAADERCLHTGQFMLLSFFVTKARGDQQIYFERVRRKKKELTSSTTPLGTLGRTSACRVKP